MQKRLSAFLVLFLMIFALYGCQELIDPDHQTEIPTEITTEEPNIDYTTLDGVYYLIDSYDTMMSETSINEILSPFETYEMVIFDTGMTETYVLDGETVTKSHSIKIEQDQFIIYDDARSFYFDMEKGMIEITFYANNFQNVYHVILAKDKEINYSSTGLDGYYMLETVEGVKRNVPLNFTNFGVFTLDFTVDGEVTLLFQESAVSLSIYTGTYIHTNRMILLQLDGKNMIFTFDDDGYLNFYRLNLVSSTLYAAKLSYQEDQEHPVYQIHEHRNYDYSNTETLKNQLNIDLAEAASNFEVNHSIVEVYQGLAQENMFVYLIQDENLIMADSNQILYVPNYLNTDVGLVITENYTIGATIDRKVPSYDLSALFNQGAEITKDAEDHYWIKVSYDILKESTDVFTQPALFFNQYQQYSGNLYIQVVFDGMNIGYVLYDELLNQIAIIAFSFDMDDHYGIDLSDVKQDFAYSIETAIIPMKLNEWYSANKEYFLPYENYYLLELEAGAYEVIHEPSYAAEITLLDQDGHSLYDLKDPYYVDDRFAFNAQENKTYYLKVRSAISYTSGYQVMIRKIDSLSPTILDIIYGESYHVETDSVFNYYQIELSAPGAQAYHVVFTPDEGEKVFIDVTRYAIIGGDEGIDDYIMIDEDETFVVKLRSSGTITINPVEDDTYGATEDNPYDLNHMTDEVFVASSHYPDDVFTYTLTSEAFTLDIDDRVDYDIYNVDGIKQTLPISVPGMYKIVTHVPYTWYYGTYQIHAIPLNGGTVEITEDQFTYTGYVTKNYQDQFRFTLTEKSLIEIEINHDYGMVLVGPDGEELLRDFKHYVFTLIPGDYIIVFGALELTEYTLNYHNHGSSTKPAINEETKTLPISQALSFDYEHEIFIFEFDLLENDFIRIDGDVFFGKMSGTSYFVELFENINYGFGEGIIRIIVMQKDEVTANIQIFKRS